MTSKSQKTVNVSKDNRGVYFPDPTGKEIATISYNKFPENITAVISMGGMMIAEVLLNQQGTFVISFRVLVVDSMDTVELRESIDNIIKVI